MYTQVHEEFAEGNPNYRLWFGQPRRRRVVDSRDGYSSRADFFRPGARFAQHLWPRNECQTIRRCCFVCEIVKGGEAAESRRFMADLAALEGDGIDPINCPTAMCLGTAPRFHDFLADTAPMSVVVKQSLHGMP